MSQRIFNDWSNILEAEMNKSYFGKLDTYLSEEYENHIVFPPQDEIFNALNWTSYAATKVVILGQDPYHGAGQAHGLCFSVRTGVKIPPSLLNIYKELNSDLGCAIPRHGYLEKWARQGVLMLNAVLTVREGEANSHQKIGWDNFTDHIISIVNEKSTPVVFILWGSNARKKKKLITNVHHLVIESSHPSPLSSYRGFLGSKPFSRTNKYLETCGIDPIDWCIPEIIT